MELTLLTEYWDDPEARAAFKRFIVDIHGLDFTRWEEAGYWDERYTPFSYFDGDRAVASMCAYLLDAVVDGEDTKLLQISGVGTAPEYRRRGLNHELTEVGLAWAARHEPRGVFLFSDEGAIPFYENAGFEAIEEHIEVLDLTDTSSRVPDPGGSVASGMRRLDMDSVADRDHVYQLATRRAPVSRRLGVLNAKLVMFHCLYVHPEGCVGIPELDCVVLAKRAGGVLALHDVIAPEMPSWDQLSRHLLAPEDRAVEFHFPVDSLRVEGTERRPIQGNHPMVRPGWPLAEVVFPSTARA